MTLLKIRVHLIRRHGTLQTIHRYLFVLPHLRRDSQGFRHPEAHLERPAVAVFDQVQKCRKKDLFSPQARWGDDGARED